MKPPRCATPIRRIPGHRSFAWEDRGEESVGKPRSTAPHAEELGMKFRSPSPLNARCRKGVQWAAPHMWLFVGVYNCCDLQVDWWTISRHKGALLVVDGFYGPPTKRKLMSATSDSITRSY